MFTGNQKDLEGWITACRLSFANQPSKFRSDGRKIIWATTFLSGPPLVWLQPTINELLIEGEATSPELETFKTFVEALKGLYGIQTYSETQKPPSVTYARPRRWRNTTPDL